jgi:hypothetical protein
MVKRDWRAASQYAQKKFGTTLSQIIADRETSGGDSKAEAQRMINEAYGVGSGGDEMTAEGKSHLKEQVKTAKLKKATNDTGMAVNEVRLGGEDAMRGLEEEKKRLRKKRGTMVAGE